MIDVAACGNLLRKTAEEGYELLEEMAVSSYHPQYERNNQRRNAGVHQVTDFSAVTTQLEALNRKIDSLNIKGTAMHQQEIFCEKCKGEHYIKDCRDNGPFYVNEEAPVNQVGRPSNDLYSNIYNLGWRQHPNFSWGGQSSQNRPQGGQQYNKQPMYRPEPRDEKSNLEQMMSKFISPTETRLQNHDASIKGLENQIDILANKWKLEDRMTINLNENCSVLKLRLGEPKKLGLGEPKLTRMSMQLADRSVKYSRGVIEDVLVKVDKFIFPADFVVLDMEEDMEMPLIFGRSFDAMRDPLEATLITELKEDDLNEEKTDIVAYFNANHPWRKPTRMKLEDLGERRDLTPPKSSIEEPLTLELKPFHPQLNFDRCYGGIIVASSQRAQKVICLEGIIYPISDSAWVSPVQCVPKKGGITVITNEKNELIPTRTVTGWRNLSSLLRRCEETNLVLNWEKCHFMVQEIIVLGHKISEQGIEVDKAKAEVIKNLPPSASIKGAYENLKERLVTDPMLVAPDWDLPFEVMCDASDTAVGAVLGQRLNKVFHTIYYASKTLDEAQLNYATTEKELLAVVFALDKFHSYLVL
ncbi:uncharacterized protein LOC142525870 [Primulina tabacum]|uniref:uncharacterized protein LOC142525870 n=1 Tax=Primulina tabacum TaxID=48773 RepID=UPI003F59909F